MLCLVQRPFSSALEWVAQVMHIQYYAPPQPIPFNPYLTLLPPATLLLRCCTGLLPLSFAMQPCARCRAAPLLLDCAPSQGGSGNGAGTPLGW